MPTQHTLITFVSVCLLMAVIPGPSTVFLLSQGALYGRASALRAVVGIEVASAIRVLATVVGLSALLASSAVAFSAIRWGGVVYLVYLGLRSLRRGAHGRQHGEELLKTSPKPLRKGVLIGLSNVKMAVFFLAFFPQFVHSGDGSRSAQVLVLGTVFWIIGAAGDVLYAVASAAVGTRVRARPRRRAVLDRSEAISYLTLAGWTATEG